MENMNLPQTTEFNELLQLAKIEPQHIKELSKSRQLEFRKMMTEKLQTLKGEERDAFLQKVGALVEHDVLWEYNHLTITGAIHEYLVKHGVMPSKISLAEATGLSRQTIYKHLKSFSTDPAYAQRTEEFALMTHQVLSKVVQSALKGDIAAAKLFLRTQSKNKSAETGDIVINNQHNYIQINSTVLHQEALQKLTPEQRNQIEEIIKLGLGEAPLNLPHGEA